MYQVNTKKKAMDHDDFIKSLRATKQEYQVVQYEIASMGSDKDIYIKSGNALIKSKKKSAEETITKRLEKIDNMIENCENEEKEKKKKLK